MDTAREKRLYPKNPIGIIALFVFFIEAISTISLKFLLDASSPYVGMILAFIIAFPSIIAALFFVTVWFRRESLYSPGDFREDASFLNLIRKVETLEVRQEAAQLDPRGDPTAALSVIKKLVEKQEFQTAIHLGRAFLKVKRYPSSLEIFEYLRASIPDDAALLDKATEYYAYSLVGLGKYAEAIDELDHLRQRARQQLGFWPSLALAYAYSHTGDEEKSSHWLSHAQKQYDAPDYLPLVKDLYPEIANKLAMPRTAPQNNTGKKHE